MAKGRDITGLKFGKITAIKPTEKRYKRSVVWLCVCECGKELFSYCGRLVSGNTKTCGCSHYAKPNEFIIKNDIIALKLGGKGEYYTVIDKEDFYKIKKLRWFKHYQYPIKPNGIIYASANINNKQIRLHELIIDCPKGMVRDHIDGNGLNNRKSNLRILSTWENFNNQHKQKPVYRFLKNSLGRFA